MEGFFQIGSSFDEIEIKELLLKRYSNIDYILKMEVSDFIRFIELARDKEKEDEIRAQWIAHLPYMSMKQLKYMSFNDYKDKVTGKNIDTRPADVIIAEINEIHEKAKKGGKN